MRGIEGMTLFHDDPNRTDFVARLAALAEQGAWTVYAWAILPNHAHFLVRFGCPLAARLGIRPQNVYRTATRGQAAAAT